MEDNRFEDFCNAIITRLNNMRDNDKIWSLLNDFNNQILYFSDKDKLKYIDELSNKMQLDRQSGGLSFFGRAPETAGVFVNELTRIKNDIKPKQTPPLHFTRAFTPVQLQQLYTGLTTGGFLPTGTDQKAFNYVFGGNGNANDFKPLEWTKTGSTTHGKMINKLSLLNLLELLNIPNEQIRDKMLLNKLFIKPDGTSIKFTGSNYTDTQLNFNSEYHIQLQQIVSTIK